MGHLMSRIPVRFGSFFSDVNGFLKFFCRFHCNVEVFLQKPLRCPCISVDFNAFSIYNANNRMTRENLKSKFQKQHPKCQKDKTPKIRQQHQRRLLKQKNVRGAIKTLRIDARRLMLLRLNTALAPGCDEPPHGMQSVNHRCRPGAPVEKDRAQLNSSHQRDGFHGFRDARPTSMILQRGPVFLPEHATFWLIPPEHATF